MRWNIFSLFIFGRVILGAFEDFPFKDMMNVMQHKGFLSSRIAIKMRLLSHPVFLDFIPKGDVMRVYRILREQTWKWERGEIEETKTTAPKALEDISPIEQMIKLAELRDAGIISEKEFQAKKKELI